jgi:hypothetical protein
VHGRRLRCACTPEAARDRNSAVALIALSEEGPKDDANPNPSEHLTEASREMG